MNNADADAMLVKLLAKAEMLNVKIANEAVAMLNPRDGADAYLWISAAPRLFSLTLKLKRLRSQCAALAPSTSTPKQVNIEFGDE